MAKARQPYRTVETRLVSEYLVTFYPDARTMQRVRLGGTPAELEIAGMSDAERRLVGVWRRWADALVFTPDHVVLIEASVFPDVGHVAQLELYMELFPRTPEFFEHRDRPLRGELVYGVDDPVIRDMAARRGLTVVLYRPPWVEDYLQTVFARRSRATLPSP